MVVASLEGFYVKYNLFIKTNIKELVNNKTSDGKFNGKPVIIFDASSAASLFHPDPLDNYCNGNVKKLKTNIEKFISNILSLGVKLTVVLRGNQSKSTNFWCERNKNTVERVAVGLANVIKRKNTTFPIICNNAMYGCFHLLKNFSDENYEVLVSDQPTHVYVANLLKNVKYSLCLAVIGQDSNYIINDQIETYIMIKTLNLNSLDCSVHDRDRFLKMIGLDIKHLPMFASLCGNEIIECENLRHFYNKFSFPVFFCSIANEINKYNGNLELLINNNNLSEMKDLLEKSIRMYSGEWEKEPALSEIQLLAFQKCKESMYYRLMEELLIHKIHKIFPLIENVYDKNTKSCEEIFIGLRKSLYAILFSEEEEVKEYSSTKGLTPNIVQVTPLNISFSVTDLWTLKDEQTYQKKLDIFGLVVSLDSSVLRTIPPLLFIPVTALRYVYRLKKRYRIISDFELDCLLTVAIKMTLFPDEIEEVKAPSPNYMAIDLSTKFLCCSFYLTLINCACGEIYDCNNCQSICYFDGILFQDIYGKMKKGAKWEEFFEKPQEVERIFSSLRNIVCNY